MARRLDFDPTAILADYKSGTAIKALAAKYGMARDTIRSRIVAAGVPLRTASDQMFCMHKRLSPEQRAARASRAQSTWRGSTKTDATMDKAAVRRQVIGSITANEQRWQALFVDYGVATVPQYAVGRFNVDLAVPDVRVAIEVQCGWHNSPKKVGPDKRKRDALAAAGWLLFEVNGGKPTPLMAERIAAHIKDLRRELKKPCIGN